MVSKDLLIINCSFSIQVPFLMTGRKNFGNYQLSLCCFYFPNPAADETDISALIWPVLTLESMFAAYGMFSISLAWL